MQILIENLSFAYESFGVKADPVLKNVNLTISEGEAVAIVGLSGSGKTTLMHHLTALLKPDAGHVMVNGQDLQSPQVKLSEIRRRIGIVFQFPETQLFADTVFDDVAFGPRNLDLPASAVEHRVNKALAHVGLEIEKFGGRSPFSLSDGEKRRTAIAGVLALEPECLALDEPTAGLDLDGVRAVSRLLTRYHSSGKTVIVVSHNLEWVCSVVDRVVVLEQGQIRFDGSVETLFAAAEFLPKVGLAMPRVLQLFAFLREDQTAARPTAPSADDIKQMLAFQHLDGAAGRRQNDRKSISLQPSLLQNRPVDEK